LKNVLLGGSWGSKTEGSDIRASGTREGSRYTYWWGVDKVGEMVGKKLRSKTDDLSQMRKGRVDVEGGEVIIC